jgi:hypothetical protein
MRSLPLKKEFYLPFSCLFLLLTGYQLAFKKTIEAWQLHNRLSRQITEAVSFSYLPAYEQRKRTNLDKLLHFYHADTLNYRSNALARIAAIAEKQQVKLSDVPLQDPLYRTGQTLIQNLRFEGNYFALERAGNEMEATPDIGVLRSLTYKITLVRTPTTEKRTLSLDIFLEFLIEGEQLH